LFGKLEKKITYTTERGYLSDGGKQKEQRRFRKEYSDENVFHAKKKSRRFHVAETETLLDRLDKKLKLYRNFASLVLYIIANMLVRCNGRNKVIEKKEEQGMLSLFLPTL
jgi:hypothetical protein